MFDPADLAAARTAIDRFERGSVAGRADRAATGAFYTPAGLARAIARQTLRPLLARCASPDDVAALRIVDLACGAGSLLLAALAELAERVEALGGDPKPGRLVGCLHGIDIDQSALDAAAELFGVLGGTPHLHRGDALLEPLPSAWGQLDAAVGNPPFGNINKLGRGHPTVARLREAYAEVWQDKMDWAALFAIAASRRVDHWGLVVPSALQQSDKGRRVRAWLTERGTATLWDLSMAPLFPDAAVATSALVWTRGEPTGIGGWRWTGGAVPDAAERALESMAAADPAPDDVGWVGEARLGGEAEVPARWHVFGDAARERWARIDRVCVPLGERWHVGKGMETAANRAFALSQAQVDALPDRRWVRRRIRGRDIGTERWSTQPEWLLWPVEAETFEALPGPLREHLEQHRATLEARAAHRRGDCPWWQWAWPLHAAHLATSWRVVLPYRTASLRSAVLPPRDPVGLTDTTQVFVPDEATAEALASWLDAEPIQHRFQGLTKHTGGGMFECFENQVREIPVPPADAWATFAPRLNETVARHGWAMADRIVAGWLNTAPDV